VSLGMLDGIAAASVRALSPVSESLWPCSGVFEFGADLGSWQGHDAGSTARKFPQKLSVIACLDAAWRVYWGCFDVQAGADGGGGSSQAAVGPPESVVLALPSRTPWNRPRTHLYLTPYAARSVPDWNSVRGQLDVCRLAREIARLGALQLAPRRGADPVDLIPCTWRQVALTEVSARPTRGP